MNDALCEHIVARKSKPMDFIIRILIIVVIVAVAIVGMPFLGFFAFALAAILALLAYYFAFPLLNVEYEYSLLNHDLDIDAIYSKEKRKIQNEPGYSECRDYCTKRISPTGLLSSGSNLRFFIRKCKCKDFRNHDPDQSENDLCLY